MKISLFLFLLCSILDVSGQRNDSISSKGKCDNCPEYFIRQEVRDTVFQSIYGKGGFNRPYNYAYIYDPLTKLNRSARMIGYKVVDTISVRIGAEYTIEAWINHSGTYNSMPDSIPFVFYVDDSNAYDILYHEEIQDEQLLIGTFRKALTKIRIKDTLTLNLNYRGNYDYDVFNVVFNPILERPKPSSDTVSPPESLVNNKHFNWLEMANEGFRINTDENSEFELKVYSTSGTILYNVKSYDNIFISKDDLKSGLLIFQFKSNDRLEQRKIYVN
ncbi:MAG: T9SS type A sorting domain-containing protein [Bacteroidetes bacterium]|nr:T9SS type A sorting domain-containing protein [Bacteroidota bacterium]